VVSEAANVRSGPGTEYGRIARLSHGDRATVIAYAYSGSGEKWFLIALADGRRGWISASLVRENSAVAQVGRAATVPPTPVPPTKTPTPTLTPLPQKTYQITVAAISECWHTYYEVYVQRGELLTLSASGTWDFGGCSRVCQVCPVGPEGCPYSIPDLEMPGVPIGALIARVDDGNPVVVGRYRQWRADRTGYLKMCMNDTPEYHNDNTGYMTVQVTVSP